MTTLERNCPRAVCKGQVEYRTEEGKLQGRCLLCSRPVFKVRLDRTPVRIAAESEASLIRVRKEHYA